MPDGAIYWYGVTQYNLLNRAGSSPLTKSTNSLSATPSSTTTYALYTADKIDYHANIKCNINGSIIAVDGGGGAGNVASYCLFYAFSGGAQIVFTINPSNLVSENTVKWGGTAITTVANFYAVWYE